VKQFILFNTRYIQQMELKYLKLEKVDKHIQFKLFWFKVTFIFCWTIFILSFISFSFYFKNN